MNSWKQEYEKNSPYQWNHCPKCGEDYNLRLIQSSNLPYKIYCTSCGEWIFEIEIIKTNFDIKNIKGSYLEETKFEREQAEKNMELRDLEVKKYNENQRRLWRIQAGYEEFDIPNEINSAKDLNTPNNI